MNIRAILTGLALAAGLSLGLFCPPTAQAQETKAERKLLRKARRYMLNGEFRAALANLKTARNMNGENPETLYLLAQCWQETGNIGETLDPLRDLMKIDSLYARDVLARYARALHFHLQIDKAERYYRLALKQFQPRDPEFEQIKRRQQECRHAKTLLKNPAVVEIENLGPKVNSPWPDYCPLITADERLLLFTSRRPSNKGEKHIDGLPFEDVYVAERGADGEWKPAYNAGAPLNTEWHDATTALSADGQTFILYRDEGFFLAKRSGLRWSLPKLMPPPVASPLHESSACLSADGNTLIFSREHPRRGDYDLYITEKDKEGNWTEPRELSGRVNTEFNENAPFLHPDGRTLYFSSAGHNSMGGYDVFKTEYEERSRSWTWPKNLGYPVSSADDDLYFVVSASGRNGYYSSVKPGGEGAADLYRIDFYPGDTTSPDAPPPPRLLLLKGRVTDALNNEPVAASLYVIDLATNDTITIMESNAATGEYLLALPAGRDYGVSAEAEGFVFYSQNFLLPDSLQYEERVKHIALQPDKMEIGAKVELRNIFFEVDKATLQDASAAELDRLYNLLTRYPELRVRILGHTDDQGAAEYNRKLSEARAKAVVDFLVNEKGVNPARLEYKGMGESAPAAANATEEGRRRNRRTEFEIIGL